MKHRLKIYHILISTRTITFKLPRHYRYYKFLFFLSLAGKYIHCTQNFWQTAKETSFKKISHLHHPLIPFKFKFPLRQNLDLSSRFLNQTRIPFNRNNLSTIILANFSPSESQSAGRRSIQRLSRAAWWMAGVHEQREDARGSRRASRGRIVSLIVARRHTVYRCALTRRWREEAPSPHSHPLPSPLITSGQLKGDGRRERSETGV